MGAYTYCFICSDKIAVLSAEKLRLNAFGKKQNDVIGTLCQLLSLPLRDNTLNYGERFRDTRFCSTCTSNMKGFNKILSDLKILENKVMEAKKVIEDQLKESSRIMSKMDLNGSLNGLKDIDAFRKEILTELNKTNPWSNTGSKSSSSTKSCSCDKNKSTKPTFQGSEVPNGFDWRQIVPKVEIISPSHVIKTEPSDWIPTESFPAATSHLQPTGASLLPSNFSDDNENDGFPTCSLDSDSDEPDEFEDEEDGPPSDAQFVTEVITLDQDLSRKKIVVPAKGKFPCPFAPSCKFTFLKKERIKFLAHNHQFHRAKVEKVVHPAVLVKTEIKTEEPEGEANAPNPKSEQVPGTRSTRSRSRSQVDTRDKCESCRVVFNSKDSYLRHLAKVHSNDNNNSKLTPVAHIGTGRADSTSTANSNGIINITNINGPKSPSPTEKHRKKRKSRGHGWGKKSTTKSAPTYKPSPTPGWSGGQVNFVHTNGYSSKTENGVGIGTGVTGDGHWKKPRLEYYSPVPPPPPVCVNPFRCDQCGLKYLFKADLTRHLIMTHDGDN